MNRFNLSFSGEILPGEPPEQVKLRFGKLFAIDDPERVERFFSGETIILRRNLERKAAAECFQQMRRIGAVAELVKVDVEEAANSTPGERHTAAAVKPPTRPSRRRTRDKPGRRQALKKTRRKTTPQPPDPKARQQREAQEQAQRQAAERERTAQEAQRREEERKREAAEKQRRERERQRREEERAQAERERQQAAAEKAAEKAAQEAARRKAERERERAAARARERAQREEEAQRRRQAAEEAARQRILAEERRREEQARRAALAEQEREQRERAERAAAQQAAREAAEKRAREEQARREQAEERRLLEEGAIQRAARELTGGAAGRPASAGLKTRLDVPGRSSGAGSQDRNRQPGEANLYQLRPFRHNRDVRERARRARRSRRHALAWAGLAALLLVGIVVVAQRFPAPAAVRGADAIAADPAGNLFMLAGQSLLVHDRAGVATASMTFAELGATDLDGPLGFAADGALLAMGRVARADREQLLRCDLQASVCAPRPGIPDGITVTAYTLHPLDGSLFVADSTAGELYKIDREGDVAARRALQLPPDPVLRLHAGLLLMNSPHGPAVSVFRYDDSAFGEQLDEILLLPAAAVEAGQDRVGDFLHNAGAWWVVLFNGASGGAGVYRFDDQWTGLGPVAAVAGSMPLSLIDWGPRTLVNDHRQVAVARFGANGEAAAPLESGALLALVEERRRAARLHNTAWRSGLVFAAVLLLTALAWAYLQRLRGLVYGSQRVRGAEPVEDYSDALRWVAPLAERRARLRYIGVSYAILAVAGCLLAMGAGASSTQLAALLLALSGPAAALYLLARHPIGHIAVLDNRLLLADHAGTYHIGGDADIQYRGGCLAMDDVVVFTGNALLPAFDREAVRTRVTPLSSGGVRVDRKTMAVKLLQARHPLALAALSCAAGAAAGLAVLAGDVIF